MYTDLIDGREVHAVVYFDRQEVNPLTRVRTVIFSKKTEFESALIFLKSKSKNEIKVLKTEVFIKVPGLTHNASSLSTLVTSSTNNTGKVNLQLFSDLKKFNLALEMVGEVKDLSVNGYSENCPILSFSDFISNFPVHG